MSQKHLLMSSLLLWSIINGWSQKIVDHGTLPFGAGEKLSYEVLYHWRFIWVDAGRVDFSVDSSLYGELPAYHFKSTGKTLDKWNWLFRVDNRYESLVDAMSLTPFWFFRQVVEGKYQLYEKINFNYGVLQVVTLRREKNDREQKSVIAIVPGLSDVLTAVYAIRKLNLDEMKPGDPVPQLIISGSQIHKVQISYCGKEYITDRSGRQQYLCHQLMIPSFDDTLFRSGNKILVWISCDSCKIPVLVQTNILIGSIKVWLSKVEGSVCG